MYIAMSALRRRSSAVASAAVPDARCRCSRGRRRLRSRACTCRRSRRRSAARRATAVSTSASRTRTANSSPADPGRRDPAPGSRLRGARANSREQLVAGAVSPRVVDDLEAVEVEVEDGGRGRRSPRSSSCSTASSRWGRFGRPVRASWYAWWRSCSLQLRHLRERLLEPAVLEQDARMAGEGREELDVGLAERADVAERAPPTTSRPNVLSSPRSGPTMASSSPRERRKPSRSLAERRRVSSVAESPVAIAANALASSGAKRSSGCMSSSPSAPLDAPQRSFVVGGGRSRISAYSARSSRRAATRSCPTASPNLRRALGRAHRLVEELDVLALLALLHVAAEGGRTGDDGDDEQKEHASGRTSRSSTTASPSEAVASAPTVEVTSVRASWGARKRSSAMAITVETSRMPTTCATAQARRTIDPQMGLGVGRRSERAEDQKSDAAAER